jgi:hypothetical protein
LQPEDEKERESTGKSKGKSEGKSKREGKREGKWVHVAGLCSAVGGKSAGRRCGSSSLSRINIFP